MIYVILKKLGFFSFVTKGSILNVTTATITTTINASVA